MLVYNTDDLMLLFICKLRLCLENLEFGLKYKRDTEQKQETEVHQTQSEVIR